MGRRGFKHDVSTIYLRDRSVHKFISAVDSKTRGDSDLSFLFPFHISLIVFFSQGTSLGKAFVAGASSGTCSTLLFQPFDLVKTRLQVEGVSLSPAGRLKLGYEKGFVCIFMTCYVAPGIKDTRFTVLKSPNHFLLLLFFYYRGSNGMLYTFYSVVRREHIIGLWRGLVPVSTISIFN